MSTARAPNRLRFLLVFSKSTLPWLSMSWIWQVLWIWLGGANLVPASSRIGRNHSGENRNFDSIILNLLSWLIIKKSKVNIHSIYDIISWDHLHADIQQKVDALLWTRHQHLNQLNKSRKQVNFQWFPVPLLVERPTIGSSANPQVAKITEEITSPRHPNTCWEGIWNPKNIPKAPALEVFGCLV